MGAGAHVATNTVGFATVCRIWPHVVSFSHERRLREIAALLWRPRLS